MVQFYNLYLFTVILFLKQSIYINKKEGSEFYKDIVLLFFFCFQPFQESQLMPPVFTGIFMEQEMRNITISGVKPCVSR